MLASANDTIANLSGQAGQNTIQLQGFTLALSNLSLTGSNTSLTQLSLANGSLSAANVSVGTASTLSLSNISATAQSTTIAGALILAGNYATTSLNAANASAFNFTSGNLTINGGVFSPLATQQTVTQGSAAGQFQTFSVSAAVTSAPGATATPTLILQNGAAASIAPVTGTNNNWFIGLNGGRGVVVATAANSTLSTNSDFNIACGAAGSGATFVPSIGSISLSSGATASATSTIVGEYGGTGTVTVDGANSALRDISNLFIGESAYSDNGTLRASDGTLTITNGATASVGNAISIGHAGGVGVATVDGPGSLLQAVAGGLIIGDRYFSPGFGGPATLLSSGTLTITNGAAASSHSDVILGQSGGNRIVTVDGDRSTLESSSGRIIVGDGTVNSPGIGGNGTLTLQDGGTASSFGDTLIGFSSGNVTVGNGHLTSTLSVGANLTLIRTKYPSSLTVNLGGLVTVANVTQIQAGTNPLSLNGGTLQTGTLLLGSASQFHWASGTLAITGSAGFSSDTLGVTPTLSPNQILRVSSTLNIPANNSLSLTGGTAVAAQLSLAGSSGAYTSTLAISNGALIIEPATSRPAAIATLRDELLYGQTHTTGITASALPANTALALIDNSTLATPFTTFANQPVDANAILIAPELLGDANADGHVDLNDLNTVLNHLGQTDSNWTSGDFDGAATIDLNDLNAVLNHLGTSYASNVTVLAAEALVSSTTPTPEPASLALLTAGGLLLLRRRSAR